MAAQIPQYLTSAGLTTVFHPLGYAKVLIQVGHEPLDPSLTGTWFGFGKQQYIYPNIFKYIGHIYRTDGFFGLYRGVGSRIVSGFIGNYMEKTVFKAIQSHGITAGSESKETVLKEDSKDELIVWMKTFFKQTSQEAAAKCCGLIVSHPLHVIMIRQIAQFVGGETEYNSIYSSIGEIYRNDGILGFFAGIVPKVIGEVLLIFMSNFASQLFNKYFIEDKELQTYFGAAFGLFFGQFVYPFQLVANVMAVNNSSLVISRYPYMPSYTSWLDCWGELRSKNQLTRGSSLFMRYLKGDPPISTSVFVAGRRY